MRLHPSCCLGTKPDWVMYNEFVLTSQNYIRTVSQVRGEWLLEIAPNYYDLSNFPPGQSKRALETLDKKRKQMMKKRKYEESQVNFGDIYQRRMK